MVLPSDREQALRDRLLRWRREPLTFFREVLGCTLWSRQEEILDAIVKNRTTWVPTGHSIGKDYLIGRVVIWWVVTRPSIVVTTANTREQIRDVLWGELREAVAKARAPLGGYLKPVDCKWDFGPKWYAIGLTSRETNAFQGKHAPYVLAVGDEAGGLPSWVFAALASCATGENDRQVFIGNLTCGPEHDFAKAVRGDRNIPGKHKVVRVPSWETPNVVAGRTVIPGLATRDYIEDIERRFGKDSPIYNARVAARDPSAASVSLIGYQHIEKARSRRLALPESWSPGVEHHIRLGCDVARYGRHTTRIWARQGPHAWRVETISQWDGVAIARRLAYHAKALHAESVAIDGGGLGSGTVDALRDLQRRGEAPAPENLLVCDVNFGMAPNASMEGEVGNRRSELYWRLRDWLWDEAAVDLEELVVEELIAPTYTYAGKPQRIYLEPKERLEDRLGRSPDDADALALAVSGHVGFSGESLALALRSHGAPRVDAGAPRGSQWGHPGAPDPGPDDDDPEMGRPILAGLLR